MMMRMMASTPPPMYTSSPFLVSASLAGRAGVAL
jgi:hypothetical protein